jgi:molybdopterin molybdotransferase
MAVLKFHEARQTVIETIQRFRKPTSPQVVSLLASSGRVLAETITADRDFPPFPRATRDGFAVRSADVASLPARLRITGQIKAGQSLHGAVGPGECVEIMTGAPVPDGADAVVMVEHTVTSGNAVEISRSASVGENVVSQGSEAHQGGALLHPGHRIGYAEVAMMAAVGKEQVAVYPKPRVAILPTGDEVVELGVAPGPYQIRNSNSYSLQAQVVAAGGTPVAIGIAPDREDRLREMIREGLRSDLLLLSGGVSAGKYDLVETVLAGLGAEFYFDGVAIHPGRPLVFGRAQGTFFFGLPGNPLSTMVTFELLVQPALALLSGGQAAPFAPLHARLSRDFRRRPGMTAFLPAMLTASGGEPAVTPVEWKGSGDIASLTRANCYLVVPEEKSEIVAGEWVSVLPR